MDATAFDQDSPMESLPEAPDPCGQACFIPPMPPLAPDGVGALGILAGLRRNAYATFPPRCCEQAMRDVLATRPLLYRRPAGDRIVGALVGRDVAAREGQAWHRQRWILAPAFTPRTVTLLAPHMDQALAET